MTSTEDTVKVAAEFRETLSDAYAKHREILPFIEPSPEQLKLCNLLEEQRRLIYEMFYGTPLPH